MADTERYDSRLELLIEELRAKLKPVCADWPDELFEKMVRGLALVTLKYEGLASPSTYDRRTTERLVDDLKDALKRSEDQEK